MQSIRNIAIIAHVDHGKTTLVDKIIDQAHILDERKVRTELLLDNNDLERERGITILSKNVSIIYNGVKININHTYDDDLALLLASACFDLGLYEDGLIRMAKSDPARG